MTLTSARRLLYCLKHLSLFSQRQAKPFKDNLELFLFACLLFSIPPQLLCHSCPCVLHQLRLFTMHNWGHHITLHCCILHLHIRLNSQVTTHCSGHALLVPFINVPRHPLPNSVAVEQSFLLQDPLLNFSVKQFFYAHYWKPVLETSALCLI